MILKRTALFLALVFSALAPAAVIGSALAQPETILVFSEGVEQKCEVEPTVSTEDVDTIVTQLDMYMAPGLSDPVTELVFSAPAEEPAEAQEAEEETEDVADVTEIEIAEPDGSAEDKGFAASGVINSAKPVLQKPSGTMAKAPFAPSKYTLTDEERDLVERVVQAEVGSDSYTDSLAVAQCIYDRCIVMKKDVKGVIYAKNAFTNPSTRTPGKTVKKAVSEVFDDGVRLTEERILYFYATRSANPGSWHETRRCLVETTKHRYFGSKK